MTIHMPDDLARGLEGIAAAAVDDLEAAIAAARLPVRDRGDFDKWPAE